MEAGGLRWHVQLFAPPGACHGDLLLLHGAGASSHSWRDIAPALAKRRRIIVPDLPGHAGTARPPTDGLSLPEMARLLGALLRTLDVRPAAIVGHSAGAAIAARMALDGAAAPAIVIGLNGAWLPPSSQGRWLYEPLAKLLVMNPLVPTIFSLHARQRWVLERLIGSTGSRIDAPGVDMYARLVADTGHVAAVLAMMACWDLRPLLADLPRLQADLHLVVGEADRTVPPQASLQVQALVPGSSLHRLPALGHLAHEEAPSTVLALLESLLQPP